MRQNPLLMTVMGNPGSRSGLRPKSAKVWCRMCGDWTKNGGPYHIPQVGPQKGNILCDLCYTGWRSGRRMGEVWAMNPRRHRCDERCAHGCIVKHELRRRRSGERPKYCSLCGATYIGTPGMHKFDCVAKGGKLYEGNGRRYRPNPFILVDSETLKVIRNWKGSMTDRKPWDWASQAARRLGRNVFVVAHPYVPQGFRAGVEVSPLFFAGGPFQVVFPDGGSRQGSYTDLPPLSNPSIGASLVGGMVGALTTHALSNPSRRGISDKKLDDIISRTWHSLMSGVQVPPLDISRIFRDIKLEVAAGTSVEQAVMSVGQRYRVNPYVVVDTETGRVSSIERGRSVGARARAIDWAEGYAQRPQEVHHVERGATRMRVGDKWRRPEQRNPLTVSEFMEVNREAAALERQGEEKSSPFVRGYYRGAADGVRGVGRRYVGRAPGHQANPLSRWEAAQMLRTGLAEVQGVDPIDRRDLRHRALSAGRAQGLAGGVMSHGPSRAKRAAVKVWERGTELAYKKNGGGRRRVTMPIERFAKLVRAHRDPALWRDFVAKCKAYHKWSHGTWPRKVTVERINKVGMKGMWIAFDMGREPEKTYIMPKGTKRKGAWKHPWESMPQLRGDAEAGIIITKMGKGNKLTDFLHG